MTDERAGGDDVDVLIVGAGQAGLASAYRVRRSAPSASILLLESASRVGQAWLDRWDSLQLFTPTAYSELPGRRFPHLATESPSRVEMADYLRDYADEQDFPLRLDTHVDTVRLDGDRFVVTAGSDRFEACQVVLASGPFRNPAVPPAAARLNDDVTQLHSYDYRRPCDLPAGPVTVVGAGNSAAQIALELATDRPVTLVTPGRLRFVPDHVLGLSSYTWMARLRMLDADADSALVRHLKKRRDAVFGRELRGPLRDGRMRLVPHRVVGADGTTLRLADGSRLEVRTVVWCTGFHSTYDWLRVPGALDDAGNPRHDHGASPVLGLHWMGLPWQSTLSSSIIHGVDADARRTAERIARQLRAQEVTS